jgi:hypothetical protein
LIAIHQHSLIDHDFENALKSPFFNFSSNESGGVSVWPLSPGQQSLCNRASFPCKTFHKMKRPITCRGPRAARAAAVFALPGELHKKITQSPSAGGG